MLSSASTAFRSSGVAPLQHQQQLQHRRRSAAPTPTQALFSFLAPAGTKSAKGPSKAQELVSQLVELSEPTEGGIKATPARRQAWRHRRELT